MGYKVHLKGCAPVRLCVQLRYSESDGQTLLDIAILGLCQKCALLSVPFRRYESIFLSCQNLAWSLPCLPSCTSIQYKVLSQEGFVIRPLLIDLSSNCWVVICHQDSRTLNYLSQNPRYCFLSHLVKKPFQ